MRKQTQKEIFAEIKKLQKEFEQKPIKAPEIDKVFTDKSGKLTIIKFMSNGNIVLNGETLKVHTPKPLTKLQKQAKEDKKRKELEQFRNEMLKRYDR